MNTGKILLTLAAMVIMTRIIGNVNNNLLIVQDVTITSKLQVLATSICTSIIEEASNKAFDEKTDTMAVYSVNSLSTTLGKEAGEVYPNFDDFDDYNNFTKVENSLPAATFYIKCRVDYVNPTTPNQISSTPTFHKRLTVNVTSPSMRLNNVQDTIRMSTVFSYWYFR